MCQFTRTAITTLHYFLDGIFLLVMTSRKNIYRARLEKQQRPDVYRETGVSWQSFVPNWGNHLKPFEPSQQYRIMGLKEGVQLSPIMPRGVSLPDSRCECFPVWWCGAISFFSLAVQTTTKQMLVVVDINIYRYINIYVCEKWPIFFIPEDAQCSETDTTPIFKVLRFLVFYVWWILYWKFLVNWELWRLCLRLFADLIQKR